MHRHGSLLPPVVAAAAALLLVGCGTSAATGSEAALAAPGAATGRHSDFVPSHRRSPVATTTPTGSVSPSTTVPPPTGAHGSYPDVPTYHGDNARSGHGPVTPPVGVVAAGWHKQLDGSVYAQPLVVHGTVVVATENNTLYGLDPATGAQRWSRQLATAQQASDLPCGNIGPTVGITGTPAYDATTGWVYAVTEEAGPHHYLVAVDPATGAERLRQQVDPAGSSPSVQQQRAALAVGNGRVYVTYGGREGDCGDYHGYVVGVPERGGVVSVFATPTTREGGSWAASGPAIDSQGFVYIAVGNGAASGGSDPYDDSDSILKLSPTLALVDYFTPATWRQDNAGDIDLGSTGPTLLDNGLVLSLGKSTTMYTLRQSSLGHIGGQLAQTVVCRGFGGTAHVGSTVWLPCTDGLRAATVDGNGVHVLWHSISSAVTGSPVVGGGAVFALDPGAGVLHALATSDGHELGSVRLPEPTSRFATPALSGSRLFVGTTKGIAEVTGA